MRKAGHLAQKGSLVGFRVDLADRKVVPGFQKVAQDMYKMDQQRPKVVPGRVVLASLQVALDRFGHNTAAHN